MKVHPLKALCLVALGVLFIDQLALYWWLSSDARLLLAGILGAPLLLPLRGLLRDRLYTYKWTGFLTLFYFVIGVSEAFSNPQLRSYAIICTAGSVILFLSSVYYSRWLRLRGNRDS